MIGFVYNPRHLYPLAVFWRAANSLRPIFWYTRFDFFWGAPSDVPL